jgi:hypothetical protein
MNITVWNFDHDQRKRHCAAWFSLPFDVASTPYRVQFRRCRQSRRWQDCERVRDLSNNRVMPFALRDKERVQNLHSFATLVKESTFGNGQEELKNKKKEEKKMTTNHKEQRDKDKEQNSIGAQAVAFARSNCEEECFQHALLNKCLRDRRFDRRVNDKCTRRRLATHRRAVSLPRAP